MIWTERSPLKSITGKAYCRRHSPEARTRTRVSRVAEVAAKAATQENIEAMAYRVGNRSYNGGQPAVLPMKNENPASAGLSLSSVKKDVLRPSELASWTVVCKLSLTEIQHIFKEDAITLQISKIVRKTEEIFVLFNEYFYEGRLNHPAITVRK